MKILPLLLLFAILGLTQANSLVTSVGRDFPVPPYSLAQGTWHMDARWNNGSINKMAYKNVVPNFWVDDVLKGDGLVSNSSTTFQCEVGSSVFVQSPTAARTYNISMNWTSNLTGSATVSGWVQRWVGSHEYNLSIWNVGTKIYEAVYNDNSNHTYTVDTTLTAGNYLAIVVASTTIGEDPGINMTAYVYDNSAAPITPVANVSGKIYFDYFGNFSLTQGNSSVYYMYNDAGTFKPCAVAGSTWACSGPGVLGAKGTNGNVSGYANIEPPPALKWYSPYKGTFTVNGQFSCPGATSDGVRLDFRNSTTGTIGSVRCNNASAMNFQFNTTINGNSYIWFEANSLATTTADAYTVTNLTISSYDATPYALIVTAFDENNPTIQKQFNITISNSSNSTSFNQQMFFNRSLSELPTGLITITITNHTCQTGNVIPRSYSLNTAYDNLNLTAYLLCDGTTPVVQTFIVQDQYLRAVQGATVTIYKLVGSTNVTIAVLTTDSTGVASAYLTALGSYIVVVSKFGYVTTSSVITAIGGTITIPISVNSVFNTFDSLLKYITWTLSPDSYLGFPMFNVNATITSTIPLDFYSLELLLANGTQLYLGNFTNATGSTIITNSFNRSEWNGTLYATIIVASGNYTPFIYTRTYSFTNSSNSPSSLTGIIAGFTASDMPPTMKAVIAVFLSLFFAIGSGFAFGASGAGMAFVIGLGFFGLVLGFLEENLIYLLVILALSLWAITRGL